MVTQIFGQQKLTFLAKSGANFWVTAAEICGLRLRNFLAKSGVNFQATAAQICGQILLNFLSRGEGELSFIGGSNLLSTSARIFG